MSGSAAHIPALAQWEFPLFPERASTVAPRVDAVYIGLLIASGLLVVMITFLLVFFAVKYRAGSNADRSRPIRRTLRIELIWITIPTVALLALFVWAAWVYFDTMRVPPNATPIYVVGKQWMWKVQHENGRRELNKLHVPVGEPIKLVITSQDVIHSFYIPAFRVKMDAVPGRYTSIWFEATKPGTYHLFCAEYCGSDHSRMRGQVVVMRPADYERWLARQDARRPSPTMVGSGSAAFAELGCYQCHQSDSAAIAPQLEGLFGRTVELQDGSTLVADEQYIRESIVNPGEKVVAGYQPIMPSFKGQVTPEQLNQLVAAIRHQEPGVDEQQQEEGGGP